MTDIITLPRSVVEQALEHLTCPVDEPVCEALRAALEQPQVEQEPVAWQSIEAMAVQRYKVVPAHDSMFYRHAVVAGDGTQQLYIGRETECENIARKFAGAFLDGAYVALLYTHPQPKREPLTEADLYDIAGNYFADEWAQKQAVMMLKDHGIGGEK